jgi:hypothetical protein
VTEQDRRPPLGCAALLIGLNALATGSVALAFARGPFTDVAQMLWYRGVSFGFVLLGAILPGAVLALGAYRSRRIVTTLGC